MRFGSLNSHILWNHVSVYSNLKMPPLGFRVYNPCTSFLKWWDHGPTSPLTRRHSPRHQSWQWMITTLRLVRVLLCSWSKLTRMYSYLLPFPSYVAPFSCFFIAFMSFMGCPLSSSLLSGVLLWQHSSATYRPAIRTEAYSVFSPGQNTFLNTMLCLPF